MTTPCTARSSKAPLPRDWTDRPTRPDCLARPYANGRFPSTSRLGRNPLPPLSHGLRATSDQTRSPRGSRPSRSASPERRHATRIWRFARPTTPFLVRPAFVVARVVIAAMSRGCMCRATATPRPPCEARIEPQGDAYRRLLQRDRSVALLTPLLRGRCRRRRAPTRHPASPGAATGGGQLTGVDALPVRTFFATGLVVTVSTALALPGRRTDMTWGGWLLELVNPPAR
jgi:hypothetical protein